MEDNPWQSNVEALGQFIRAQRQLAHMSLRELADLSHLSNAYLSQIERGLHEPSMRAVTQIARAFNLSTEAMLREAGLIDSEGEPGPAASSTVQAILADPDLTDAQKQALLAVYRSFDTGEGEPAS